MRIALLTLITAMLAGCNANPHAVAMPEQNTVGPRDGLSLTVGVPKRLFAVGERFTAAIDATNNGGKPVTFNAGGARAYIVLQRNTDAGWTEIRRYPRSVVGVQNPWTLKTGWTETFTVALAVEPDWPTAEPLRLAAQLDGGPNLTPGVVIQVKPGK